MALGHPAAPGSKRPTGREGDLADRVAGSAQGLPLAKPEQFKDQKASC